MKCTSCDSTITAYPCACGYTGKPFSASPLPPITQHAQLGCITKEEFGLNLYEVIKTIGGILGIDQQRANAIHRQEGHQVQALMVRRKALQVTLAQQLPTLNDSEMTRVLEKYPFVTGY